MNWRSKVWILDWLLPVGFGLGLCFMVPLRTAFEFGSDEGFELMKGLLVSRGYPLFGEFWNDQPPLHTELLALLFRICGPSAYAGRLLSVMFAMVMVGALYQVVRHRSGWVAGLLAVGLLTASLSFIQLSVSVMLELPAMSVAMASIWAWSRYRQGKESKLAQKSTFPLPLPARDERGEDRGEGYSSQTGASSPRPSPLSDGGEGEKSPARWNFPESSWKWLVISGVLFGCALQVKFTAVLLLPALLVDYLVNRRRIRPDATTDGERNWWRSHRDVLLWSGASLAAFGIILAAFYQMDTLSIFFGSHFSQGTQQVVASEGYRFRFGSLFEDLSMSVPATVGVILIVARRRWDLLLPVVLLATALGIHAWHRPFWYYYHLHFSIPLAWLAAVGIVDLFQLIWKLAFGSSAWGKIRFGIGLLTWSAVTSLALSSLPENLWHELAKVRVAQSATEDRTVAAFKSRAAQTRWVFTNNRIAAFWAGLPIPPELAVIPSKRIWSGQISEAEVLSCLNRYQPEMVLVPEDWETKFKLTDYLREHYRPDTEGGIERLYLRK